jgi:hypothetical protein
MQLRETSFFGLRAAEQYAQIIYKQRVIQGKWRNLVTRLETCSAVPTCVDDMWTRGRM